MSMFLYILYLFPVSISHKLERLSKYLNFPKLTEGSFIRELKI